MPITIASSVAYYLSMLYNMHMCLHTRTHTVKCDCPQPHMATQLTLRHAHANRKFTTMRITFKPPYNTK